MGQFTLGYYDGDGSISINKKEYYRGGVSFTGTNEIIDEISEKIKKYCKINSSKNHRYPYKNNNNASIAFCGNNQVVTFLDWLYKDSKIYLNRKFEKFVFLKGILNNRIEAKEKKKNKKAI